MAFHLLALRPEPGLSATLGKASALGLSITGHALSAIRPVRWQCPTPDTIDAAGLQAMHARKTGALIRAAVGAGAIMAGADDRVLTTLDTYATEIGLAFQIVDDILDEEGSAGSLGKTAGKDKAAGKPTYPAFYGLQRSKELAAACHANANRALERAGLLDSRLAGISNWVIHRKA